MTTLRRAFSRTQWTAASALAVAMLGGGAWLAGRMWAPLPDLAKIRLLADNGEWPAADQAVQRHLARRPTDARALFMAARIAAGMNDLPRCAALLDRVPADSSLKAESLVRQGQALWEWRDARGAEQAWRRSLVAAAKTKDRSLVLAARAELVSLLMLERRDAEARDLLWQMLPGHTEPWRVLVTLIRLEIKSTNPAKVIPILEEVLSRDPADTQARLGLASYLVELVRWDDVLRHAEACVEQDPVEPRGLQLLLQYYQSRQQWDEMDAVIGASPSLLTSVVCLRLIASRSESAGKAHEAEASFRKALEMDPFDPVTHYQLGQLLLRRGRRDAAQEHVVQSQRLRTHQDRLQRFVSQYVTENPEEWLPPAPDECVSLATDLESLGRLELAQAWLQESLRQQPDFTAAKEHLGRLTQSTVETAP